MYHFSRGVECKIVAESEAMESLWQDIRYALRTLVRNPLLPMTAVLTLALGIGATTAVFSVVDQVILEPLPYPDPDRVVRILENNPQLDAPSQIISSPNFTTYRNENETFDFLAAFQNRQFDFRDGEEPEAVSAGFVTSDYFKVLGFAPLLGREFTEGEVALFDRVVILGHPFWQKHFGGDPGVLGRPIILSDRDYVVVGVMGPSFPNDDVALWTPAPIRQVEAAQARWLSVIGRTKANVPLGEAQADIDILMGRLGEEYPEANGGWSTTVVPLHTYLTADARPLLYLLTGAVGFVLMIACANVGNLLLSRAVSREHEIGVRAALGAGRGRLLRQLLTESTLISVLGGAMGLLVAFWGVRALAPLIPGTIPAAGPVAIDREVLVFTLAISLLVGILVGLAPALGSARSAPLRDDRRPWVGTGISRSRAAVVVGEVALALMLLIGAGLLIRSFVNLQGEDMGFRTDRVMTLRVKPHWARMPGQAPDPSFYLRLRERIERIPGVLRVGGSSSLPTTARGRGWRIRVEGQTATPLSEEMFARPNLIAGDYFTALGIPQVAGRFFTEQDGDDVEALAIINARVARRLWGDQDPVGRGLTAFQDMRLRVVGVVGNTRDSIEDDATPKIYLPYRQFLGELRAMMLAVQTTTSATNLVGTIRAEASAMDDRMIIDRIRTMDAIRGDLVSERRFSTLVLGIFAAVALLLSAAGVYSVMAYSINRRTGELGIRKALGARPQDLVRMVLGQGASTDRSRPGIAAISEEQLGRS